MKHTKLATALSRPPRWAFPRGQGDWVMYGDVLVVVSRWEAGPVARGPWGASRVIVTGHPHTSHKPQAGTMKSQREPKGSHCSFAAPAGSLPSSWDPYSRSLAACLA